MNFVVPSPRETEPYNKIGYCYLKDVITVEEANKVEFFSRNAHNKASIVF